MSNEVLIPSAVAVCPICGDHLQLEDINASFYDESTGEWLAEEVGFDCVSAPDIDSEEWEEWFKGHWENNPYYYWLPLTEPVLEWLNEPQQRSIRVDFGCTEVDEGLNTYLKNHE